MTPLVGIEDKFLIEITRGPRSQTPKIVFEWFRNQKVFQTLRKFKVVEVDDEKIYTTLELNLGGANSDEWFKSGDTVTKLAVVKAEPNPSGPAEEQQLQRLAVLAAEIVEGAGVPGYDNSRSRSNLFNKHKVAYSLILTVLLDIQERPSGRFSRMLCLADEPAVRPFTTNVIPKNTIANTIPASTIPTKQTTSSTVVDDDSVSGGEDADWLPTTSGTKTQKPSFNNRGGKAHDRKHKSQAAALKAEQSERKRSREGSPDKNMKKARVTDGPPPYNNITERQDIPRDLIGNYYAGIDGLDDFDVRHAHNSDSSSTAASFAENGPNRLVQEKTTKPGAEIGVEAGAAGRAIDLGSTVDAADAARTTKVVNSRTGSENIFENIVEEGTTGLIRAPKSKPDAVISNAALQSRASRDDVAARAELRRIIQEPENENFGGSKNDGVEGGVAESTLSTGQPEGNLRGKVNRVVTAANVVPSKALESYEKTNEAGASSLAQDLDSDDDLDIRTSEDGTAPQVTSAPAIEADKNERTARKIDVPGAVISHQKRIQNACDQITKHLSVITKEAASPLLDTYLTQVEEHKDTIDKLRTEIEALRDEHGDQIEEHRNTIFNLRAKIRGLEGTIGELYEVIEVLQARAGKDVAGNLAVAELRRQLANKAGRRNHDDVNAIQNLQMALETTRQERDDARQDRDDARQDRDDAQAKALHTLDLEEAIDAANENQKDDERIIKELREQLDTAKAAYKKAHLGADTKGEGNKGLSKRLIEEAAAKKKGRKQAEEDWEDIIQVLAAEVKKGDKLTDQLAACKEQLEKAKRRCKELEKAAGKA